tara:strand:- start:834 stop:974 length:141 start_codon:yes stop_codon:yes gene_type:complete
VHARLDLLSCRSLKNDRDKAFTQPDGSILFPFSFPPEFHEKKWDKP